MKRKTASFTGSRPIFTGSPSIVPGGFNLDVVNQKFNVGDTIPAGTLAIKDEVKRTVQVIKTAKVVEIDAESSNKKIELYVDEFYEPCFAVGDAVLAAKSITGTFANAPKITAIEKKGNYYAITLSAAISGLAKNDTIIEVIDKSNNAAVRGDANSVTIADTYVDEFETSVDVTEDTMQYALYVNRVPPIPDAQKDSTKQYLKGNVHVRLTKSH